MEADKTPSLIEILKSFQAAKIRYLLIGGQAVIQYGSPILTKDADFWVAGEDKETVVNLLVEKWGFENPSAEDWKKKPLIRLFSDWHTVDVLSAQKMTNVEGKILDFEECFQEAEIFEDPKNGFSVRVPSLEDLIALKKLRKPTPKDLEDLRYLEALLKKSSSQASLE